jgi:ribosome-binding ATPase
MIADLDSLEKRAAAAVKKARGADKEAKAFLEVAEPALEFLRDGKPARALTLSAEQKPILKAMQLLSAKPVLYVCNVEEGGAPTGNAQAQRVADYAAARGAVSVVISAAIEAEIAQLGDETEKVEYLETLGLAEPGLARVIHAG